MSEYLQVEKHRDSSSFSFYSEGLGDFNTIKNSIDGKSRVNMLSQIEQLGYQFVSCLTGLDCTEKYFFRKI